MKSAFVRVSGMTGIPEMVRSLGGDVEVLMHEVGLDPDILKQEDGIYSYSKGVMFYEHASRVLNEPNFGLKRALTCAPHFNNFGPVVYLSAFEKTARKWIYSVQGLQHVYSDGQKVCLREFPDQGVASLRLTAIGLSVPHRQFTEMQLAALTLLVASVLKVPGAHPKIARFRHQKPEDTTYHERIFGNALEFDAEYDEVVYDINLLDTKLKGPVLYLRPLVNLYMQYRMRNKPDFDMSTKETLTLFLQSVIGTGKCSLEIASEALVLKPKKLQRLLAEEGTSFSEVLDGVRRKLALTMLKNPDLKIKVIAAMLDYANTQAFNLAFNRWTGRSPVAYRKVLAENNEMLDPL